MTPLPGDDAWRLEQVTEELLNLYEEINVLYTVSGIAARSADVAVAGSRILEEAVTLLAADVGFISYASDDLKSEEPEPVGLPREACRILAAAIVPKLAGGSRSLVAAPFSEGAAVPRAPEAIVAAPLSTEGEWLGFLCLGRRGRGSTFTSGDEKIVTVLAAQAALVIAQRRNLDLTRLTRGLEERTAALKGIVEVGREITSSLDADRILRALADLPARVLGFDRCAVLVDERGTLRVRAVSGVGRVDRADAGVVSLERLLVWVTGRDTAFAAWTRPDPAAGADRVVAVDIGSGIATPASAEFGDRAAAHFEIASCGGILAIPLRDDQGSLGAIGLEAGNADVLTDAAREAALIVAQQATVALRNARLYRELPFVSLLEPLRRGRARISGGSRRRLLPAAAVVGALIVASMAISSDLRIPGTFVLKPGRRIEVVSRVRGVIREVSPVVEGSIVRAGEVLARLDDTELRLRLGEADSKLQSFLRTASKMEAEGRAADLQMAKVESGRWSTQRDLLRGKIDEATVRAPEDGVLLTPRLQERNGELLEVGSTLCALADLRTLRAEIAVGEGEADALQGSLPMSAVLKFEAFPERDVPARIIAIRPAAEEIGGRPSLVADAEVAPDGEALRPGMTGQAKISTGSRSLASLALRGPYRFLRRSLWW